MRMGLTVVIEDRDGYWHTHAVKTIFLKTRDPKTCVATKEW